LSWSESKLNRIETGVVTVQALEVEALLKLYGVTDEKTIDSLKTLAVVSRTRAWWNKQGLTPEFQQFVAYEAEASVLEVVHALFIPGLLQTKSYAETISSAIRLSDPSDPLVSARVELRMDRQAAFFERLGKANSPAMHAVLDESVLDRPVGGVDVMRDQLDHLLSLAEKPFLSLTVLPRSAGVHAGLGGSFERLEFFDKNDPSIAFVESAAKDTLLTGTATNYFKEAFQSLCSQGQNGDDALTTIRAIRDAMK
jgi:hypothetical protein